MGLPLLASTTHEMISCCQCGMEFAVPSSWADERRRLHDGFHCPNKHSLVFKGKSAEEKQRAEIERLQKRLAWKEESLASANKMIDTAHRRNAALRGVVRRVKRRVGSGVCPCCHRTFSQLARHMVGKHPRYKDA